LKLLLCNYCVIESSRCLCAFRQLLNTFVAYMQRSSYLLPLLLMCRPIFIKLFDCLCAKADLLIHSLAYV